MRMPSFASGRSATIKVATIAVLILVLLIPVGMIRSVIFDRGNNESVAVRDISRSWGGEQLITGPILRLPYRGRNVTVYGSTYAQPKNAYVLSEQLKIVADVRSEIRYRGIQKVPVYKASISMRGYLDPAVIEKLDIDIATVDWQTAELLIGISESTALVKVPLLTIGNRDVKLESGSKQVAGLPHQLGASIGEQLDGDGSPIEFEITLLVNGTGALRFLPLAGSAEATMTSNWSSPSFTGRRLPGEREVRDDGFDASWQASSLGRALPSAWIDTHSALGDASGGAFGVRLIQTVGLYQLMHRAIRYAVLFIGLTFVTYFLMEIVGKLRLHPLQYLLVGLANTLFYMLLLALSEHIGFDLAYTISAMASAALISGYSAAILERRTRAVLVALVLAGLYLFLYLTLKAETFALLAGSIGLWAVLAAVMYLTRRINWYASDEDAQLKRSEPVS